MCQTQQIRIYASRKERKSENKVIRWQNIYMISWMRTGLKMWKECKQHANKIHVKMTQILFKFNSIIIIVILFPLYVYLSGVLCTPNHLKKAIVVE